MTHRCVTTKPTEQAQLSSHYSSFRAVQRPQLTIAFLQFGKDPQPGSWAEIEAYKAKHKYWASYDHQGVHVFSGVPNRAFVLASEALGGYCWEKAGKIWWTVLKTHRVSSTCSFVTFADATVDMARQIFDDGVAKSIRDAWDAVGVLKPTSQEPLASLAQNP